jgi:hypothetical protein
VLVDVRDRPFQCTYVPQDNIRLASEAAAQQEQRQAGQGQGQGQGSSGAKPSARAELPGGTQHPHLGKYFDGLGNGSKQYRPNAYLRSCYPQDFQA